MDKRTTLAMALTALVIVGVPMIFRPPPKPIAADSAATKAPVPAAPGGTSIGAPPPAPAATRPVEMPSTSASPASRVDTLSAGSGPVSRMFVAPAAALARVDLADHKDLSTQKGTQASLAAGGTPLIRYRLVLSGRDTVAVAQLPVTGTKSGEIVRFTSTAPPLSIEYAPGAQDYLTRVRATVDPTVTAVLIDLPETLESFEADTLEDQRNHAFAYKPMGDDVKSFNFTSLDSTVWQTDKLPMLWVSARNKYFVLAIIAQDSAHAFESLRMRGGHRLTKSTATAFGTVTLPVTNGAFGFDIYTGPQTWAVLQAAAPDLENVHPHGGWLHGVAQPFVTIVMRMLLWLKQALNVNYGWVLVIFGVVLRLLMWPLNQNAMRSSMKMQRLQPEMQALQKRYANDPEGQRKAMMKLYQDHGMNPLSPILGCLPMMLPMPVLFALYFVFQNTIEFRGVPFLWLPDLSLKDPYYITPVFMGASMLLLSWLSMKGSPPNPQAKIMTYTMPAFMTFLFLNFASGLNLYYGVQNLVAIPQQLLLMREKTRAAAAPEKKKT
jgi:YidC/Oxa1 family membrane protein insertase